jgi:hypothetical protein
MSGERAEKFVVLCLRLLAAGFFVSGVLFLAVPDTIIDDLNDLGDSLGGFNDSPETGSRLWLALSFAYMMVIAAICAVTQADVIRYRPFIGVLVVAKVTSSLAALGFYLFEDDAFAYLVGFIVDAPLALLAVWLWSLVGRIGRPVQAEAGATN